MLQYPLDVRLTFTNTAANHRLRWNLSLPAQARTSLAGLPFAQVERPAGCAPTGKTAPRVHPEHPAECFAAAGGLALFAAFPVNYELVRDGTQQRLAVTILRSVGYLCSPQQTTTRRGTNAGPHTRTPDAQCLGRSFDMVFAVRPYTDDEAAHILYDALRWRAQPAWGQMDPTVAYVEKHKHVHTGPFFSITGDVIVSAFKPKLDGCGTVLRLFHPWPAARCITLHCADLVRVREVNLNEQPLNGTRRFSRLLRTWHATIAPYSVWTCEISGMKQT